MKWKIFENSEDSKNISSLGIASVGANGITALFWIYLAQVLGEENYGELGYFIAIASIAYSIAIWGSDRAITVYVAKGVNIQPVIYFSTLISSGIAAVILFFSFENIGISFFVIGAIIFNITQAEILGRKHYKRYSKHLILQKIIFIVLSLVLVYFLDSTGVLIGFGISGIVFSKQIFNSLKNQKIDFNILKQKAGFIANSYGTDLISKTHSSIDKLIIGPIFGFAILGNYYLGMQIFAVMIILPEIVFTFTLPKDATSEKTKKIKILIVIVSVGIALLGAFVAPVALTYFIPEFGEAPIIISIISFAIIPYTISSMLHSKFLGEEKSRHFIISFALSIIALVISIFGLSELGVIGFALAFLLSEIVKAGYLLIISGIEKISEEKQETK
jgi:O-antigen/teichoic acid export membrane protein